MSHCGTIFDRIRVHWFIHAKMSYFVRLCMDYEDRNWLMAYLGAYCVLAVRGLPSD